MLSNFLDFIQTSKPDILGAWNCLTQNNKISTPYGYFSIKEVVDKKIPYVFGFNNKTNKVEKTKVVRYYKKESNDIYKITTNFGKELEITGNHPILIGNNKLKYEKVENIKKGDTVVIPYQLPFIDKRKNIDLELFYIYGLLFTDGSIYKKNLDKLKGSKGYFCNKDYTLINFIQNYIKNKNLKQYTERYNMRDKCYYLGIPKEILHSYCQILPYNNKSTVQTRINDINKLLVTKGSLGAFFAGVIDGDGWIGTGIGIGNCSSYIIKDFTYLLSYLGINSRPYKGGLSINKNMNNMDNFYQYIYPYLRGYKKEKFEKLYIKFKKDYEMFKGKRSDILPTYFKYDVIKKKRNFRSNYIQRRTYEKYTNNEINKDFIKSIYFEKIVSITRNKHRKEVYNIETETNNYFAENILVHNCNFDIRYLTARMEKIGLDINKLSPFYTHSKSSKIKLTKWLDGPGVYGKKSWGNTVDIEKNIQIFGMKYFDLLLAFKILVAQEYQSWKLDYIAEKELGIGKLRTNFDIGKTWLENPEFIEDYNYVDVFLIKELDEKVKLVNKYTNIKNLAYLYDINDTFSSGRVLDNYVLRKYKDTYIFPNKLGYSEKKDTRVGGGYVKVNQAGLFNNVAVLDFKGCYPNLIRTFNLSGDVIRKEEVLSKETDNDETADITGLLPTELYTYNKKDKQVTYQVKTDKFIANATYSLEHKGVMGESVGELMELREVMKKEAKKYAYGTIEQRQKQQAQESMKFIINAAYGVSAYPGFRLFSNTTANIITAMARNLNKWVTYRLNQNGWKDLFHDTDSISIELHSSELKDNLEEVDKAMKIVNEAINEFVRKYLPEEYALQHTLQMELKGIYSRLLLFDVKKRYAGFWKYYDDNIVDNKLHFMGMDMKKANTIEISRQAQEELTKALLKNGNIENILTKYYSIVKESNNLDLFKFASKLEKHQSEYKANTPAVRATKWSNAHLHTQFRGGTKFYLLYTSPTLNVNTDVIAFEDVEQIKYLNIKINKEKYLRDLHSKFENIIRTFEKYKSINDTIYKRMLSNNKDLGAWI